MLVGGYWDWIWEPIAEALVRIWVEELLFDEYLLPFWLSLLLVIYQL
jgi:hypothetical protein